MRLETGEGSVIHVQAQTMLAVPYAEGLWISSRKRCCPASFEVQVGEALHETSARAATSAVGIVADESEDSTPFKLEASGGNGKSGNQVVFRLASLSAQAIHITGFEARLSMFEGLGGEPQLNERSAVGIAVHVWRGSQHGPLPLPGVDEGWELLSETHVIQNDGICFGGKLSGEVPSPLATGNT